MWLAAHATAGAAIQRGLPWQVWVPAAILSHPVLDRLLEDHIERPWEYAANLLGIAVLVTVARRFWPGMLLAGLPDAECFAFRLGLIPSQPVHDLWWRTAWQDSYLGVVSVEALLVGLVLISMIWGNVKMPGAKSKSLQNPEQYEALKKRGFSKESAARISNAKSPGHKVTAPPPKRK